MVEWAGRAGSMTMPRDFTPYYARVAADIRAQIDDGRLPPGTKLPSTSELADAYGYMSPNGRLSLGTIRKAIEELLDDGTVRGHQGVGVFVAERRSP